VKGVLKFKGFTSFFSITLVVFFCCQSAAKKPDYILSQDQMVKVLSDIYLTEQKVLGLSLPADSAQQLFYLLEARVFEKLQVSDSVFRQSLAYYNDHPAEIEKVYSALVDSLQLQEQRAPHRFSAQPVE
jgi:hypothetical protein